jgi:hypothetical protein
VPEEVTMETTIIEWDGTNVPDELRLLPPGRYILEPFDDVEVLSEEEDAAVREALDEFEAGGELIPFDEVMREIKSRYQLE